MQSSSHRNSAFETRELWLDPSILENATSVASLRAQHTIHSRSSLYTHTQPQTHIQKRGKFVAGDAIQPENWLHKSDALHSFETHKYKRSLRVFE